MERRQREDAHELFVSIREGVRWLFLTLPDDRWAITRNGKRIAVGTSLRTSLDAGVAQFLSLTNPVAVVAARCDPVVCRHLDHIEAGAAISQMVQTSGSRDSTGHKVYSQQLRAL